VKYSKQIVTLTAQEILLSIFDMALPFFEASSIYRISARKYAHERQFERAEFRDKIYYLKRRGLIESFTENKEQYFEITQAGLLQVKKFQNKKIQRPQIWDKNWRVVIFDVPNKNTISRNLFRNKLLRLGFEKIQESVYVHPFECTVIIKDLASELSVNKNVIIMISSVIQGEEEIIEKFLTSKVLFEEDIKLVKK
jgi:CRISPR-associated endonuclease Cas2